MITIVVIVVIVVVVIVVMLTIIRNNTIYIYIMIIYASGGDILVVPKSGASNPPLEMELSGPSPIFLLARPGKLSHPSLAVLKAWIAAAM